LWGGWAEVKQALGRFPITWLSVSRQSAPPKTDAVSRGAAARRLPRCLFILAGLSQKQIRSERARCTCNFPLAGLITTAKWAEGGGRRTLAG